STVTRAAIEMSCAAVRTGPKLPQNLLSRGYIVTCHQRVTSIFKGTWLSCRWQTKRCYNSKSSCNASHAHPEVEGFNFLESTESLIASQALQNQGDFPLGELWSCFLVTRGPARP